MSKHFSWHIKFRADSISTLANIWEINKILLHDFRDQSENESTNLHACECDFPSKVLQTTHAYQRNQCDIVAH